MANKSKITILTGFYGSGKSEVAIQLALKSVEDGYKTYIADLDVVNVYFRSRECEEFLKGKNIEILGNVLGSDANLDVPHISANVFKPFYEEGSHLIIDLAGTEVGLRVTNSMFFDKNVVCDLFCVINAFRDNTETVEQIVEVIDELNHYSIFPITGIVNNSNLLNFTTEDDVLHGVEVLNEVSNNTGIPVVYNVLTKELNKKIDVKNKLVLENLYLGKGFR